LTRVDGWLGNSSRARGASRLGCKNACTLFVQWTPIRRDACLPSSIFRIMSEGCLSRDREGFAGRTFLNEGFRTPSSYCSLAAPPLTISTNALPRWWKTHCVEKNNGYFDFEHLNLWCAHRYLLYFCISGVPWPLLNTLNPFH
jgi:hypothetical protein